MSSARRNCDQMSLSKKGGPLYKIYTKDVVCLLPTKGGNNIPIPRGGNRTRLADMGLIGKVSINSTWKAEEVAK